MAASQLLHQFLHKFAFGAAYSAIEPQMRTAFLWHGRCRTIIYSTDQEARPYDTTVVSANVDYPTDTGLLARAVSRMSRLVRRVKAVGAAPRTPFRDRTRAVGRRVRSIAAHLRLRNAQARDQAQAAH
jgi:hypothetical protein